MTGDPERVAGDGGFQRVALGAGVFGNGTDVWNIPFGRFTLKSG